MPPPLYLIGLDIGGTKIYGARFNHKLKIIKEIQIPTQAQKGKKQVIQNIAAIISNLWLENNIKAIGIAWAGFVDGKRGFIAKAPNIPGFKNIYLAKEIKKQFKVPVSLENDAKLSLLAEHRYGQAKKYHHLLGIVIGTGIGGAVIINDQLYRGHNGFAGEIGHTLCPQHLGLKALEEFYAGPALKKYLKKHSGFYEIEDVIKEYNKGNKLVVIHVHKILDGLAITIYNLLLLYNPQCVVFGGGIGIKFVRHFEKELIQKIKNLLEKNGFPLTLKIHFSQLKNSGALGAAILAQQSQI